MTVSDVWDEAFFSWTSLGDAQIFNQVRQIYWNVMQKTRGLGFCLETIMKQRDLDEFHLREGWVSFRRLSLQWIPFCKKCEEPWNIEATQNDEWVLKQKNSLIRALASWDLFVIHADFQMLECSLVQQLKVLVRKKNLPRTLVNRWFSVLFWSPKFYQSLSFPSKRFILYTLFSKPQQKLSQTVVYIIIMGQIELKVPQFMKKTHNSCFVCFVSWVFNPVMWGLFPKPLGVSINRGAPKWTVYNGKPH